MTNLRISDLSKGFFKHIATGYCHFRNAFFSWPTTAKIFCLPNYGPSPNSKALPSPSFTYIIKECMIYQLRSEHGSYDFRICAGHCFAALWPYWAAITQYHPLGGLNSDTDFWKHRNPKSDAYSSEGANSRDGGCFLMLSQIWILEGRHLLWMKNPM